MRRVEHGTQSYTFRRYSELEYNCLAERPGPGKRWGFQRRIPAGSVTNATLDIRL